MNNFGACLNLETALPSRDEGSMSDDFARGIDGTDVSEDWIGNCIFWSVSHSVINALFAGIGKGYNRRYVV